MRQVLKQQLSSKKTTKRKRKRKKEDQKNLHVQRKKQHVVHPKLKNHVVQKAKIKPLYIIL